MIQSNKPERNAGNHVTLTINLTVKLVPLPKETFTSLVTVIKAKNAQQKKKKRGKTNYKKGKREKATDTGVSSIWVCLTGSEFMCF